MKVLGVDPGANGALALIDSEAGTLAICDMPFEAGTANRKAVSPTGVANRVADAQADYAFVEEVTASPQMGVTSSFAFGRSLGIVLGASAGLSVLTLVRPQVWKAKTGTPKDKNQARRRAQQLFPRHFTLFERVKDDGRAEAAILAFYGLLSLGQTPTAVLTSVTWPQYGTEDV